MRSRAAGCRPEFHVIPRVHPIESDKRYRIDRFRAVEAYETLSMIRMLNKKRIDAIISDSPQVNSLAETSLPEWVDDVVVPRSPVQTSIAAPATSPDNPRRKEMKDRFNRADKNRVADGLFQRLMKKHRNRVDRPMAAEDRKVFETARR